MPDAWETAHGLNARNPADGATLGTNGMSNLETYLNERARASATPGMKEP
jgi:pectate lyase